VHGGRERDVLDELRVLAERLGEGACVETYPLDVLAGAAIGSTIGLTTVFFYRQFKWKKAPKPL